MTARWKALAQRIRLKVVKLPSTWEQVRAELLAFADFLDHL